MHSSKNMKLLYAAAFAQAFILWYAVEKLFMRQIGFSDTMIASAVTIMTAAVLLFETPAGILADRWSRKGVLIVSNIALIAATLLASFSTDTLQYTAALVLLGIYTALYSGVYDSIIYDATVEQYGNSKRYRRRFGLFQALSGVALVMGSITGSLVGETAGVEWAYWLTIPCTVLSCLLLFFYKEPRLHKAEQTPGLMLYLSSSLRKLSRPAIRPAVLATVIVGIVMGLQFSFSQLWYLAVALPVLLYGPAYAALQACLAFGGLAADRLRLGTVRLALLFAVSSSALTVQNTVVIIAGQILLQTTLVIVLIQLSGYLHDRLESSQRSASNSAISTLTKLGSLPVGLLLGFISQEYSIFTAPLLIAGLLATLIFLLKTIDMKQA